MPWCEAVWIGRGSHRAENCFTCGVNDSFGRDLRGFMDVEETLGMRIEHRYTWPRWATGEFNFYMLRPRGGKWLIPFLFWDAKKECLKRRGDEHFKGLALCRQISCAWEILVPASEFLLAGVCFCNSNWCDCGWLWWFGHFCRCIHFLWSMFGISSWVTSWKVARDGRSVAGVSVLFCSPGLRMFASSWQLWFHKHFTTLLARTQRLADVKFDHPSYFLG